MSDSRQKSSAGWSRRGILALGLGGLAQAALAEAPLAAPRPFARPEGAPTLVPGKRPVARRGLADYLREADLGGTASIVLRDNATGEVRDALAPDHALPPASVAKALTTLYALDTLGPEHRFATRLLADGAVADGVLQGDLVLFGGGDPGLDTDHLADMIPALKAAGIARVEGRFLVWGGGLARFEEIEPGQPDHVSYNPAVSGLNLNYNRVYFEWAREGGGYTTTMQARAARHSPQVTLARMALSDRALPVYSYTDGATSENWTVARSALGEGGSRWLPVRHPALYAGEVFRILARQEGVSLPEPVLADDAPAGTEIARHESGPLREIARDMLRYSNNLTAEVLGLAASKARALEPRTLRVSAAMMSLWLRESFGPQFLFHDHSGLSAASRISALQMTEILASPAARVALRPLLREVVLLDAAGNPLADPPAEVQAKTGTLNFVSSLAGYAHLRGGADTSFAIFTANEPLREEHADSDEELPPGASSWNGRSKRAQQQVLQHWGRMPGA